MSKNESILIHISFFLPFELDKIFSYIRVVVLCRILLVGYSIHPHTESPRATTASADW
jgi:hypothetical protein